jgi:flagellar biosynthetic protein FliR
MINIPDITAYIGSFMWALFRIAAMVTIAPVFGSRSIPARVKLGIALGLTVVIVPIIPMPEPVAPLSADAILITIQQIIIGAALGLALQFVFAMFVIGGQVIAYQMGLGFSKMVDPQSGTQVPVVSQFYIIVLTLMFFALNGHLTLIRVLAESFTSLPISTHGLSLDSMWTLIQWSGAMYVAGIQIALPAVASIMLVNFTFAVVTRSAPQFNIFSIGFPMTMIIGFFVIMVTLTGILPQIKNQLNAVFLLMKSLVS